MIPSRRPARKVSAPEEPTVRLAVDPVSLSAVGHELAASTHSEAVIGFSNPPLTEKSDQPPTSGTGQQNPPAFHQPGRHIAGRTLTGCQAGHRQGPVDH